MSHLHPWCRSILAVLVAAYLALPASGASAALPVYDFKVVASYPHDTRAYTQGLFYLDGSLFESTGQVGQSNIRRVRLKDGVVLQSQAISPGMFGEGMVNWGQELISVTWQDRVGFRWDLKTLALKSTFSYPGEGWALTQDGVHLILSDGTPVVRFLDPRTFRERRRIRVTAEGRPVSNLNEIEWVNGEIFGNIWQTKRTQFAFEMIANPQRAIIPAFQFDLDAIGHPRRRRGMAGQRDMLNRNIGQSPNSMLGATAL